MSEHESLSVCNCLSMSTSVFLEKYVGMIYAKVEINCLLLLETNDIPSNFSIPPVN